MEETGAVLVIEILEYQNVANGDACAFFLKDLASANEASTEVQHIRSSRVVNLLEDEKRETQLLPNFLLPASLEISSQLHACITKGSQKVAQGKDSTNNSNARWIDVEICVLRLENVHTDLLITLSVPRREIKCEDEGGGEGEQCSEVFKEVLLGFNIKDWSIFG